MRCSVGRALRLGSGTILGRANLFAQYKNPDASLLIRVDFSDDDAWRALCSAVQKPEPGDGFCASFECVSDPAIGSQPPEMIAAQVYVDLHQSAVFFADVGAFADPAYPVLCVDGSGKGTASFRVIAAHIWGPENNLRLSNMDFADFGNAKGADGVFRGF
jgi:hypothetical protein